MKIDKDVKKVDDSLTVNRYDNGFMIEFNGRDSKDDWITKKYICQTEKEVFEYLSEIFTLPKS